MLLTELAEAVTQHLNDTRGAWAPELVEVKTELDPDEMLQDKLGVYIVPLVINYTFDGARTRGGVIAIQRTLRLALVISRVFTELRAMASAGVTNWDEAKGLVDCREQAELAVMSFSFPGLTLQDVDPDPIEQLELDHRNFIAMTSFSWQEVQCESNSVLSMRSSTLNGATELERIRDSIRSRLSSVAKPERR